MAADQNSLAAAMNDPKNLLERPESRLTQEERDFLGITAMLETDNEALRMQALQRLVIRMTVHDCSAFDIQHEMACVGLEISLLRIKAILENPLVASEVRKQRSARIPENADEATALAMAAPDCIRLFHEVVKSTSITIPSQDGGVAKVQPLLMSDRLFAAKQILDRHSKTAPVTHRKTTHEGKGLFDADLLVEIKENQRRALLNEAAAMGEE